MTNEELRQVFENRFDCYADKGDESVAMMAMTQARFVEVATDTLSAQHHVSCNYQAGPIGGYGCICEVVTKRELAESRLWEGMFRRAERDARFARDEIHAACLELSGITGAATDGKNLQALVSCAQYALETK